jgi:hypothetical protein
MVFMGLKTSVRVSGGWAYYLNYGTEIGFFMVLVGPAPLRSRFGGSGPTPLRLGMAMVGGPTPLRLGMAMVGGPAPLRSRFGRIGPAPLRSRFGKILVVCLLVCALWAGGSGSHAEYVGGTISNIPEGCTGTVAAVDEQFLVFHSKKASWRVPYEKINLIEYGQKVDRRVLAAVLISPLFLLSKKRQHFLTVGYSDDDNHQQAMIFRVEKGDIRSLLVSLEARTGRKVEYQDEAARVAGKG